MSVLYSRIGIQGLLLTAFINYNNIFFKPLENGLGIYNGLFNVNIFTQSFNLFIIVLAIVISLLTSFYPRKLVVTHSLKLGLEVTLATEKVLNKNSKQYTIIEYTLITIFVLCGAMFLMSTGDLVSLFLSIELQSYGLYILATLYRDSESATNSGLTYFLLGGLSSCFILLGSAILYVSCGTTNLDNIYIINSISENINYGLLSNNILEGNIVSGETLNLNISSYINFSLIILTVGFLFKISAAPFHFWSPDVYDGIPTIVTSFVAIIAKISIFVVMLELVTYTDFNITGNMISAESKIISDFTFGASAFNWKNILIFSSLMSLIVGSVLGLTQYRIKRLFAYSTISHVGFILLALSINKMESIQAYVFYIMQYSLSNLNAFLILVSIGYTLYKYLDVNKYKTYLGERAKLIDIENSPIQLTNQIRGYFYINVFLSISFAITLFSFVGIPPLIGFFAKQMVLSAALDKGYVFMTLVSVITSVIGAVYYLNIVKLIFFSENNFMLSPKTPITSSKSNNEAFALQHKSTEYSTECINDELSMAISVLTMAISLFIFMPEEWFRIVSIISFSLFNN